jgi:WD40 repeat protein
LHCRRIATIVGVVAMIAISVGTASSTSDALLSIEKSIRGVDAYAWAPTGSLVYATSDGTLWSAKGPDFAKSNPLVRVALPQGQKIEQIALSPDGRSIAVVSPRLVRPNYVWDTIWLVDLNTSQLRDLLPAGAPFGGSGRRTLRINRWFADGRIAFVMHCGTGCVGLHAVQTRGSQAYWDFCDASGSVFWSPAGKDAVVQNEGQTGGGGLGLVSASDGVAAAKGASYYRPRKECSSVFTVPFGRGLYFNSWFSDSKTVLYTDAGSNSGLLKLWNTLSGVRTTLVAEGSSGALSPDGRYVAFLDAVDKSATTGRSKPVLLKILDWRSKTIVASEEIPIVESPIQWSPSPSYLAILERDGKLLLAKLTPAGIEVRQTDLAEPEFYHELSWSPDGKHLTVWGEASGLKIFDVN